MAKSSVMLSVPQLVDLALNSPEMGVINFTVLHALLHVLVEQSELKGCTVEFRGDNGERLQNMMKSMKPAQSVTLTQYVVNKEGADKTPKAEAAGSTSADTVILIEQVTESVITPHVSVAFSKSHLKQLHDEMEDLKEKVKELSELPGNLNLIAASRDKSQPVVDMFQLMTLVKRMSAAEEGVTKIASMMEDLARATPGNIGAGGGAGVDGAGGGLGIDGVAGADGFRGSIASAFTNRIAELERVVGVDPTVVSGLNNLVQEVVAIKNHVHMGGGIDGASSVMAASAMSTAGGVGGIEDTSLMPPDARMANLEMKCNDYGLQITSLDTMFNNQMTDIQTQFADLEHVFNAVLERINAGVPGADSGSGSEMGVPEIYAKLVALQTDVESLAELVNRLILDKDDREQSMNAMLEQIELLKTVKADREDLEDALADKADACAVNRKVSHDQFDAACDDLSKGIEDALSKLTQQEALWQQALDDIQREIGNKLDKMELAPLRDFVNNKLKMLQDKLKSLSALKKESEAAGAKSKYLKDVNCISCDNHVVMRKHMDATTMPQPPALPPNRSMAPYLAYELDALRKQQKCFPNSKNLNHFENAMNAAKSPRGDDHVCNRYCGGSHTTTTPQQRVTRLGHFLTQWGPEVVPMGEGTIRGTDGQMYKSSDGQEPTKDRAASTMMVQGELMSGKKSSKEETGSISKKPSRIERKASGSIKGSKASLTHKGSHTSAPGTPKKGSAASVTGSKKGSHASVKHAPETGGEGEGEGKPPEQIPEETPAEVANEESAEPPAEEAEGATATAEEAPVADAPPEEAPAPDAEPTEEPPPAED